MESALKPARTPAATVLNEVKQSAQQTIGAVNANQSKPGGSTIGQPNAIAALSPSSTDEEHTVRATSLAPIGIVTNVLNAALAPFINPTPGRPAPQNPVLWGVLAFVRRQFQDTPFGRIVLNRTPVLDEETSLVVDKGNGEFLITPHASDPDGDDLTYTVTVGEDDRGTVTDNLDGTFTYQVANVGAWDKSDVLHVTVSDEQDYPHLHGLAGFFRPGGGHTDTIELKVEPTAAPTPEVIELPEGHTVVGSDLGTVGADGKIYRATKYSDNGADAYALVVQRPGGDTEIIELPGEPIGELAFGPGGTAYQNVQTLNTETGLYNYAITVLPPAPAAATFALRASNALDIGPNTVSLPGEPVG